MRNGGLLRVSGGWRCSPTAPPPSPILMFSGRFCSIGALLLACGATASSAQAPSQPPPATLRLSDEERAAVLDHNSETQVDAMRGGLGSSAPSRQIHGELGAMVGSNGARGAYGVAAIPLGDKAGATVSFETSRFGGKR
jgi:hypothetical protein